MGRRLIPERELSRRGPLWKPPRKVAPSCCISSPFGGLSTTRGEITYVLLTRAPLYRGRSPFSHDLHVLGAPLTFVLSQDQTLQLDPSADADRAKPLRRHIHSLCSRRSLGALAYLERTARTRANSYV